MIEAGLQYERRAAGIGEADRLFKDFIAHYATHIADRSAPFPGLDAALDRLTAQGCVLAVCTNKLEGLSRLLLDALGLSSRFAVICGQDTFGVQKPNPDMVRRTIAQAGGDVARAVMVGDSANGIDARAAGVPVIAVDFRYTEIPVTQLGADCVISHLADLPDAVSALLGQGLESTG